MKIRDLINEPISVDVYDDLCEELAICFDGPQPLLPDGEKHFEPIMDYELELFVNCRCPYAILKIDGPDEDEANEKLGRAKEFFYAAAGYCACSDYDRWFGEVS